MKALSASNFPPSKTQTTLQASVVMLSHKYVKPGGRWNAVAWLGCARIFECPNEAESEVHRILVSGGN